MAPVKSIVLKDETNSSKNNKVDDIAIKNFKMNANSILDELRSYHSSKKRQIEHCFQKLFDNTSQLILKAPIDKIIEDFWRSKEYETLQKESQKANHENLIVDQSIDGTLCTAHKANGGGGGAMNLTGLDDDHEIDLPSKGGFENLTSTVKKVNKANTFKLNIDSAINEQSMIPAETPIRVQQQKQGKNAQDQYMVKILYFLTDFTQASVKLSELNTIDMKSVHENCVDDLKTLGKAMSSVRKQ